jgi:hypothetical protein
MDTLSDDDDDDDDRIFGSTTAATEGDRVFALPVKKPLTTTQA